MGAFYRVSEDGALTIARDGIATPTGTYVVSSHGSYTYPIDGAWRYFATDAEALSHFSQVDPNTVPERVSMMQARRALFAAGLLDAVNTAVAAADVDTQVTWEYATEVRRASPFIAALGPSLGLSAAQIDDLFRAASAIE